MKNFCIQKTLAPTLLLLIATSVFTPTAAAQAEVTADECRAAIDYGMARVQRRYRIALFGWSEAYKEPVSAVRFTDDGRAWYKINDSTWENIANTGDWELLTSTEMDAAMETDIYGEIPPFQHGVFSTPRMLTSDLIPYLTETMRDFQCRAYMHCERIDLSMSVDGSETTNPESVTVDVPGCVPADTTSIPQCHFANTVQSIAKGEARSYCDFVAETLIEHEIQVLKMLVEYDAAYRSLAQFAGIFDAFLDQFRWVVTGNLRSSAAMMGWLDRFPCFLSDCDAELPDEALPVTP